MRASYNAELWRHQVIHILLLFFLFICWGSFLNILAYRFINNISLFSPSCCPKCKTPIAWYDNIPLISYGLLRGNCRSCRKLISWLYPFTELLTGAVLTLLYITNDYFWGHFILVSALIVTIRSDLESMLISRFVTLALVPLGLILSTMDLLPIVPLNSILGAGFGYLFLWTVASMFKWFTRKDGIGQGDLDLMALIGSFTGVIGAWVSLLIGSLLGSVCGLIFLYKKGHAARYTKIPFGPFLAIGTIIYLFFQDWISSVLLGF